MHSIILISQVWKKSLNFSTNKTNSIIIYVQQKKIRPLTNNSSSTTDSNINHANDNKYISFFSLKKFYALHCSRKNTNKTHMIYFYQLDNWKVCSYLGRWWWTFDVDFVIVFVVVRIFYLTTLRCELRMTLLIQKTPAFTVHMMCLDSNNFLIRYGIFLILTYNHILALSQKTKQRVYQH